MRYDVLIKGGSYPDFDTNSLKRADIALLDGRIAAVLEPGSETEAKQVLCAEGKIVSPGFIDLHMHEDDLSNPEELPITRMMTRMGVTTAVDGNCGEQYQHLRDMKADVEKQGGLPLNYLQLVGYNHWRESLGIGRYEAAGEEQIRQLIAIAAQELKDGAYGISFGLEYDPGISYEEMCRVVKALGSACRFVSVHFRDDSDKSLASIQELARLSRDTGVKVQISHLGSLAGYGSHMQPALDFLQGEMAENPLLAYDIYPYAAFSTAIGSAVFDMDWRSKWQSGYEIIQPLYPPYVGCTVDESIYNSLRRDYPEQSVVCFAMTEENIRLGLADKNALYGSDGGVHKGSCHPRASGTFPRILGKYVREERIITLMDALERMTKKAAARVDLTDRGQIRPGFIADLCIFDPDTILDGSDFTNATKAPVGISYVLVSGEVVWDGADTDALPGRVLC